MIGEEHGASFVFVGAGAVAGFSCYEDDFAFLLGRCFLCGRGEPEKGGDDADKGCEEERVRFHIV